MGRLKCRQKKIRNVWQFSFSTDNEKNQRTRRRCTKKERKKERKSERMGKRKKERKNWKKEKVKEWDKQRNKEKWLCLVPSIRRWIMKIKNDLLNILEKGRKKNSWSMKCDTRKKKKSEKLTVGETQRSEKKIYIYIYIYVCVCVWF